MLLNIVESSGLDALIDLMKSSSFPQSMLYKINPEVKLEDYNYLNDVSILLINQIRFLTRQCYIPINKSQFYCVLCDEIVAHPSSHMNGFHYHYYECKDCGIFFFNKQGLTKHKNV